MESESENFLKETKWRVGTQDSESESEDFLTESRSQNPGVGVSVGKFLNDSDGLTS